MSQSVTFLGVLTDCPKGKEAIRIVYEKNCGKLTLACIFFKGRIEFFMLALAKSLFACLIRFLQINLGLRRKLNYTMLEEWINRYQIIELCHCFSHNKDSSLHRTEKMPPNHHQKK
jgi:hypothetical protein